MALHKQGMGYKKIAKKLNITAYKAQKIIFPDSKKGAERSRQKYYAKRKAKGLYPYGHPFKDKLHNFERNSTRTINLKDVKNKFGENPTCYLTGKKINIHDTSSYSFDHIIPRSKGGKNTLDNLGICRTEANQAKHALLKEDFIQLCKDIVYHEITQSRVDKSG